MMPSVFRPAFLCMVAALLPTGCAYLYKTTSQPKEVVQSSIAIEILLGGPLEKQPATKSLHKEATGKEHRRNELTFTDTQGTRTRYVRWAKALLFKTFGVDTRTSPVSALIPQFYALRYLPNNTMATSADVGLKDVWQLMAGNEQFTAGERDGNLAYAVGSAIQALIAEQQRLVLLDHKDGKISSREAFETIAELESRYRNARRIALTRLTRLQEISRQKQELYQELAGQAQALAINQRALTDHHLQITTGAPALDSFRYRYDLYKGAYERLRERIEKAYEEGRKENKERREKIENARSPLDALRKTAKGL